MRVGVLAAMVTGLVLGGAGVGYGQYQQPKTTNKTTTPKKNTNTNRTQTKTPAATAPAAPVDDTASKVLVDARTTYQKANTAYSDLMDKLTKDFEATPDMVAALQALKDATTKLASAKAPVLEKVKATAAFQKTAADQGAAASQLDQLRNEGSDTTVLQTAAAKLYEYDALNQKRVADAYAADADVVAAQGEYNAAQGKVNQMRADFRKSLDSNADVTTAKGAKDDAQKALADAQQHYATAKK